MTENKDLLLRVLSELNQSKTLYDTMRKETDDRIVQARMELMVQRISEDIQWVRHVLCHKCRVTTR